MSNFETSYFSYFSTVLYNFYFLNIVPLSNVLFVVYFLLIRVYAKNRFQFLYFWQISSSSAPDSYFLVHVGKGWITENVLRIFFSELLLRINIFHFFFSKNLIPELSCINILRILNFWNVFHFFVSLSEPIKFHTIFVNDKFKTINYIWRNWIKNNVFPKFRTVFIKFPWKHQKKSFF